MNDKVTFEQMLPLIEQQLKSGGEVRFKPNGTSMLPLVRQGIDEVVIGAYGGGLKKYDIPFYRRKNGAFVMHRLVKKTADGRYLMRGDHQDEFETGITDSDIIGVVKCVIRGGKPIYSGTLEFRLWGILGPLYIRTKRRLYEIKGRLSK